MLNQIAVLAGRTGVTVITGAVRNAVAALIIGDTIGSAKILAYRAFANRS